MNWQYYHDRLDMDEYEEQAKQRAKNGEGGQQTDVHELIDGEGVSEEAKLKGAKDLFQRTINKSAFGHSQVPDAVKDLIKDIEARLSKIDYKRELEAAVKKSVLTGDRKGTWTRPSKRFGYYSQGTKFKDAPKICVLADTSGSISHTEIAEMSNQVADILKAVDHELTIGLWHTSLYHTTKFKKNMDFKTLSVESGGTDVTDALKYANSNKFDFVVVFTDGYIPELSEKINMTKPVLFVITRTGTKEHPLKKMGKTIQMV
jgi:predicted metal-dependent peptidase